MLTLLENELRQAGLSIHSGKTKILTTDINYVFSNSPVLVEAGGLMVEVLRKGDTHKYLGKRMSGDLRLRGQSNLSHRKACGWAKFHSLHGVLTNRNIPVKLRLELFDAVVSPTVLYSLSTTPLTVTQLEDLDVMQRKMLRRIAGWVRLDDEGWDVTGHRMKARLQNALCARPVNPWSQTRHENRERLLQKLDGQHGTGLGILSHVWIPTAALNTSPDGCVPRRPQARPRTRWTDHS